MVRAAMYLPRTLEHFIAEAAHQFPVLLVTGARQVGKTTLLRHISEPDRKYVTLDDPLLLDLAQRDPALFFQRFAPPLLIDEIQYAPQLLPYIKLQVDSARSANMFWLTGSQHFNLMKNVSESLAGRVAVLQLFGLSRREMTGRSLAAPFLPTPVQVGSQRQAGAALGLMDLYRLIWRGSFPAIALNQQMEPGLLYGSYVQTYLQRDVRELANVGNQLAFTRFLRAAAARTGQILNLAELARDCEISPNTAKNWLSILEASGLVYLLEPYHTNLTKRLVKRPKLYFLDTGLCAYLTGWSSPETLEAGAMSGAILETWVISELLKSYQHNGIRPPFYYYRDKDAREIDLLIVRDATAYPVEIKKTASPRPTDTRQFSALGKLKMPIGPGALICLVEQPLPLSESVTALPASEV